MSSQKKSKKKTSRLKSLSRPRLSFPSTSSSIVRRPREQYKIPKFSFPSFLQEQYIPTLTEFINKIETENIENKLELFPSDTEGNEEFLIIFGGNKDNKKILPLEIQNMFDSLCLRKGGRLRKAYFNQLLFNPYIMFGILITNTITHGNNKYDVRGFITIKSQQFTINSNIFEPLGEGLQYMVKLIGNTPKELFANETNILYGANIPLICMDYYKKMPKTKSIGKTTEYPIPCKSKLNNIIDKLVDITNTSVQEEFKINFVVLEAIPEAFLIYKKYNFIPFNTEEDFINIISKKGKGLAKQEFISKVINNIISQNKSKKIQNKFRSSVRTTLTVNNARKKWKRGLKKFKVMYIGYTKYTINTIDNMDEEEFNKKKIPPQFSELNITYKTRYELYNLVVVKLKEPFGIVKNQQNIITKIEENTSAFLCNNNNETGGPIIYPDMKIIFEKKIKGNTLFVFHDSKKYKKMKRDVKSLTKKKSLRTSASPSRSPSKLSSLSKSKLSNLSSLPNNQ